VKFRKAAGKKNILVQFIPTFFQQAPKDNLLPANGKTGRGKGFFFPFLLMHPTMRNFIEK